MTPATAAALRHDLDCFDTAGLKVAAVRKAALAARRDWPGLPEPLFEEAVIWWAKAINDEEPFKGSLSQFIESYLLTELEPHVVVAFRGKRFAIKAVSRFGGQALTAVGAIAGELHRALEQLWQALPAISPDEALTLQLQHFGIQEVR